MNPYLVRPFCPNLNPLQTTFCNLEMCFLYLASHQLLCILSQPPKLGHHHQPSPTATPSYVVEVGDGHKIKCKGVCREVPLKVQEVPVQQQFFLFGLGGIDMVLGMEDRAKQNS